MNIKPSHFIIGYLSLFITSSLLSSSKFTISGFVTDKQTGKPIPDANIVIINTNLGTASKDGGYYYINNIAPGTYAIMVSVIGYDKIVQSGIRLQADHILNFTIHPKAIDVSPVMITATLSEHLLSKITVSSDVLTQLHIQDLNGNTTGEIIESVCGLFSKTFDGFAGVQTPSIRGSNADQILVLMDGMRLNTAQGGGVDLNLMPLATLERIEVVRGGHSALLGSDAVGGTIHLLTKNSLGPKKSSYGFNSTLGSFGTRIININGSQKWRALSLFFNYNHTQTDGNFNFITPDTRIILTRKNNDFKGNNIFTKTIWDISPLHKIQIQYQNFQTEKGSAGSVNVDPWTEERMITPKARSNSDRQFLSLQSENQLSQQLRFKEQVYYQIFDYQYQNPEGWAPVDDKHINKSFGLHVQGNLSLNRDILLSSGFEFRQDKLKSSQIQANDRFVQGLFTQAEIHKGLSLFSLKTLWTIIPAVRWDNYSDVRSNISPKVGFMVSTGQVYNVSIKANLGQSFRVPTFNDLYWPEDEWGNKGNADLHPETSTNIDVCFQFTHQSPSFWQADVTYFTSRIKDLIQWSPITNDLYSPWVPQNVGRAFISGIETKIRYDFPNRLFYLKLAHTYMQATDDTPGSDTQGKILIYRPENKIDLFTGCNIGPVTANMNYRIISSRYISSDNLLILDSYHLFNANVSSTIEISSLSMNIKIQVMNMLNKTIYITDGYPLAGREFRLTLGVQY